MMAHGATFWFALWLEGGLVPAGQANYIMGLPYRYFLRIAFAVFLMLLVARGSYLLARIYRGRSDDHLPPQRNDWSFSSSTHFQKPSQSLV